MFAATRLRRAAWSAANGSSFLRPNISAPRAGLLVNARFQHDAAAAKKHEFVPDWSTPVISYSEVKKLSEQPSEDIFLIDVREPDEVMQGSIPSAVSVPLSEFPKAMQMPEDAFFKKYRFHRPARDKQVVFYCRSGKRSATASDIARRNGFTNVKNYEGSWLDWVGKEQSASSS